MVSKETLVKHKVLKGIYTLYAPEEVMRMLEQAGFVRARFQSRALGWGTGICAMADK